MNRRLLILFFCFPLIVSAQMHTAEKVFKKVNNAVVRIFTSSKYGYATGQGSGVILKSKKWIITNAHVVETGKFLQAEHHGKIFDLDSIILRDEFADIMIIRIGVKSWEDLKNVPDLKVFDSDKITIGQRVYAIGSPLGFENSISEGIVSGIRQTNDTMQNMIQISAPISGGSSGGAILDAKARLIGISSSVLVGEAVQNINFAIPVNRIFQLVNSPRKEYIPLSYDSCLRAADDEFRKKHFLHALNFYKQAERLSKGSKEDKLQLTYMQGRCFLNLNLPDSAIANLQAAIATTARKYCYYYLGYAWMQKRKFEQAKADFLSAISIDSLYADAYNGIASVYVKQNQLDHALEWLFKSARVKNPYPETQYLTAKIDFKMGRFDEAAMLLTELIKWKPYYAEAIYFLAAIYFEQGYTDRAFNLQQRAFELDPNLRNNPPD